MRPMLMMLFPLATGCLAHQAAGLTHARTRALADDPVAWQREQVEAEGFRYGNVALGAIVVVDDGSTFLDAGACFPVGATVAGALMQEAYVRETVDGKIGVDDGTSALAGSGGEGQIFTVGARSSASLEAEAGAAAFTRQRIAIGAVSVASGCAATLRALPPEARAGLGVVTEVLVAEDLAAKTSAEGSSGAQAMVEAGVGSGGVRGSRTHESSFGVTATGSVILGYRTQPVSMLPR